MDLIVENENYETILALYKEQIIALESAVTEYIKICGSFFTSQNFGTYIQEVLQEIVANFYNESCGQLSQFLEELETVTTEFLDNIVEIDNV